jgi:L-aspartate oxidase
MPPHRYLIQFDPKHTPHLFTDVLIIGAGIAGLRAALEVPASLEVLVVTKDKIQQSNSSYAQGGIATVLSPEDRFENHIEDTLTAGGGLCDRAVVELVVREAPEQINELRTGKGNRKRVPCSKEMSRDLRTVYATARNGFI